MKRKPDRQNFDQGIQQPKLVSSLQDLPERSFEIVVRIHGVVTRFNAQTLLPKISKKIKWILIQTLPKEIPPAVPGGETRYDMGDLEYQKKKVDDSRLARAITLWHGLGHQFWGSASADVVDTVILEKIEGQEKLDDSALDAIWEAFEKPSAEQLTEAEKKELQERVNFTSGSKSPKS